MMKSWAYNFLKTLGMSVLFVFLFANCKQSENDKNGEVLQSQTELILETLFFYSIDELKERFGESNIQTQFIESCETCGPEGTPLEESYYITTLFPGSKKEVIIDWNSNQTKVTRVTVGYSDGNEWMTKEGFRLGDSISKINRFYNNKPVQMLHENEYYYNVNDYYILGFNPDELFESDNLMSTDSNLKNLLLKNITLMVPGYSE